MGRRQIDSLPTVESASGRESRAVRNDTVSEGKASRVLIQFFRTGTLVVNVIEPTVPAGHLRKESLHDEYGT